MTTPRVPDELLSSPLPDWCVRVWLAVRKVQGENTWAWANVVHYAELAGKSRSQTSNALSILEMTGWIETGKGRDRRCLIGTTDEAEINAAVHQKRSRGERSKRSRGERNRSRGEHKRSRGEQHIESRNESRKESFVGERARARESSGFLEADIERIYQAYPRKVGKQAALKAIRKALHLLQDREGEAADDPAGWLLKRTEAFARSPAGQAGRYCPYPATWMNQGRYDDDEAEWYKRNGTDSDERKQRAYEARQDPAATYDRILRAAKSTRSD